MLPSEDKSVRRWLLQLRYKLHRMIVCKDRTYLEDDAACIHAIMKVA